jgi:hypothetical protein
MANLATGYRALFTGTSAQKANIEMIGSSGISMNEEWARKLRHSQES